MAYASSRSLAVQQELDYLIQAENAERERVLKRDVCDMHLPMVAEKMYSEYFIRAQPYLREENVTARFPKDWVEEKANGEG